jgi:UDP-3-O-[3-hydroxymyristoyl] N-acetylglucosamine deacetylase
MTGTRRVLKKYRSIDSGVFHFSNDVVHYSNYHTTIIHDVCFSGTAVHTGSIVHLRLRPQKTPQGIRFIRTDLPLHPMVIASYEYVKEKPFCTSICNGDGVEVHTIEHLMAALFSVGIYNVDIEINGPEVPIMDGSSQMFIDALQSQPIKKFNKSYPVLKIIKEKRISNDYGSIAVLPSSMVSYQVSIDAVNRYGEKLGQQSYACRGGDEQSFYSDIAPARTYGLVKDVEKFHAAGLALGASLDNTIGIDNGQVMNEGGLRYENEMARHKVLDLIGDLSLAGCKILASFVGINSGHSMNNQLLREIFDDPSCYVWVDSTQTSFISSIVSSKASIAVSS